MPSAISLPYLFMLYPFWVVGKAFGVVLLSFRVVSSSFWVTIFSSLLVFWVVSASFGVERQMRAIN